MKEDQTFTGRSAPEGNLLEALEDAIRQALGGENIRIDWRLEKVQGEAGGFVGRSVFVTISAVKRV
jgi:hypothetical protein